MANPPRHLHITSHSKEGEEFKASEFSPDEKIYRRYKESPTNPKGDYFAGTSSDEIDAGLSVNRSKYCPDANDVLWRNVHEPVDDEIPSCNYTLQNGEPIFSVYGAILESKPPLNLTVKVNHTWTKCNVSHCDVKLSSKTSALDKAGKRDVRLYIASLFKEIS